MATKEELIAQGFDEETAGLLAENSNEETGGGVPFPIIKLNYDQKDILINEGVPKGAFISGYKVDGTKLEMTEAGEVIPAPMKCFIVASVYQVDFYNTDTESTEVLTPIFESAYDTPKIIDSKSGKTIAALKQAKQKTKFSNILLLMVEKDGKYEPYLHYTHGVSYHTWKDSLADAGVADKDIALKTNFVIGTKRVPTKHQPAWVLDLQESSARDPKEIMASIPEVSDAIKKFNAWKSGVNASMVTPTAVRNDAAGATSASSAPEVDILEDEIPFGE